LQLDAAVGADAAGAWKKCFVKAPVSIVVGVSRDSAPILALGASESTSHPPASKLAGDREESISPGLKRVLKKASRTANGDLSG
jgi:hypothetical protein